MAAKPPISVRRPFRPAAESPLEHPVQVSHAPVPNLDPDGPEALAFALRGRMSGDLSSREGEGAIKPNLAPASPHLPADAPDQLRPTSPHPVPEVQPRAGQRNAAMEPPYSSGADSAEETPLISVKLPPEIGRRLAAVADRRGSKRTMVAIEVLTEPLRQLAAEHRAGLFPELPRIVSGTVRSSIAFALPPDLAADLDFVLRQRRAVRAQVVTRLLVPAIERVYATEIGGRGY